MITPVNITSIAFLIAEKAYFITYFAEDFSLLMTLCVVSGITKATFLSLSSVLWFDLIPTEYFFSNCVYAIYSRLRFKNRRLEQFLPETLLKTLKVDVEKEQTLYFLDVSSKFNFF